MVSNLGNSFIGIYGDSDRLHLFFMTPYQIVPGGIYGISTILNWKLGFPIGMAALCFNLPLSLIGFKMLGRDFGLRTFICFGW